MTHLDRGLLQRGVESLFHSPSIPDASRPGAVGLELELIPVGPDGSVPGADSDDRLDRIAADARTDGRFTFEPGGQFEYSGPAFPSLSEAVADTEATLDSVTAVARAQGIALRARGLAPWFRPEEVGLRRPSPRYRAMDRYFTRRQTWGRWMMRLSASLQVNLDFGPFAETGRRWRLANALSPVLQAAFANSPATLPDGSAVAGGRGWIWRQLDPSRTGMLGRIGPEDAPWAEYLDFALAARVMFGADMRPVGPDGARAPRFADWWAEAGPSGPTEDDWVTHLGTLFPDVRPRRWMEIRVIDVPERPWWSVPPALVAALLYDSGAAASAGDMLASVSSPLDDLSDRAIRRGLADPSLRQLAADVFEIAEAAMDRFPAGWFGRAAREATAAFRERYVETGRTQADEAREAGEIARLTPDPEPTGAATTASLPPRSS